MEGIPPSGFDPSGTESRAQCLERKVRKGADHGEQDQDDHDEAKARVAARRIARCIRFAFGFCQRQFELQLHFERMISGGGFTGS